MRLSCNYFPRPPALQTHDFLQQVDGHIKNTKQLMFDLQLDPMNDLLDGQESTNDGTMHRSPQRLANAYQYVRVLSSSMKVRNPSASSR